MFEHVLITGGAGFVGSTTACDLKKRFPAMNILCVDNLRRDGSALNLPRLRAAGVEFTHADVRNREDMLFPDAHFDLIIECSAEPSVNAGFSSAPDYVFNTNLVGTFHCLELARRCGSSMLFISTSRVYPIDPLNAVATTEEETRFSLARHQTTPGMSINGVSEDFPLEGHRSLYGATKLSAELAIREYGAMFGLPYIINRCGVIAGPWQMAKRDQGIFTLWMARHIFHQPLSYLGWGGYGKQVRDLLHISDYTNLIATQMENFSAHSGKTFNVGGGQACSLSLAETTALCQQISGQNISIEQNSVGSASDIKLYITDNQRITDATGWEPLRTPVQIMDDIFHWIVNNRESVEYLWLGAKG